jgi:hypothetical protein
LASYPTDKLEDTLMTQTKPTYFYDPEAYWKDRLHLLYYRYLIFMVNGLAKDAKSLIDVGASELPLIENFDWIPKRYTIDIKTPYTSENVTGIKANFFDYQPEQKFDFVMCCQVLEHIPKARDFTQKLFEIGNQVLISVPFMWPEGVTRHHVHDPIDLDKLEQWTGRKPDYYIIVTEPLIYGNSYQRLICYYHTPGKKFELKPYREKARSKLFEIKVALEIYLKEAQGAGNDLQKLLGDKPSTAQALKDQLQKEQAKTKALQNEVKAIKQERDDWKENYEKVINSSSWRITEPIRKIAGKIISKK